MTLHDDGRRLLAALTGRADADFRDGQWEAIEALVEGRRRALVVQRTGWGKSAVYFIATRLLRDRGAGPTVLVSPLLALMRNQVEAAERVGVRAATINSTNRDDWRAIEEQIRAGEVDVLLISPERLNNRQFRADVLPDLVEAVGLFVVDEAHCISDWGHDFRPDYRRIQRVLDLLPAGVPVLCTTATANDRVVDDIRDQLGDDLLVSRGPLERESLRLSVLDLPDPAARLAWLARIVPTLPGSGIVYCLTIGDALRVAEWLCQQGIDAVSYSGDGVHEERIEVEERLLANDLKVVAATSALGMGFDKPDLSFVIHYQSPGSAIAYYQQVGRAGRAIDEAHGILLRGHEDADIQDWFITTAFPSSDDATAVIDLLESRGEPVSVSEIEAVVNVRRSRIEGMLKVLDVEGAVEQIGSAWQRTLRPWTYPHERIAKVTAARRTEQQAMRDYATTDGCRMAHLLRLLDDPDPRPCGRCDRCTGAMLDPAVAPVSVADASAFLRSQALAIQPRKQWIRGSQRPRIPPAELASPGRALSRYNDGGWGSVVRAIKYEGQPVPEELVDAAVILVASWRPEPAPAWVTSVPGGSPVIADLARQLAGRLRLPFEPVVRRVRQGQPQKAMENSSQQLANVYGAFDVTPPVPDGAVLLVDDIVDSGWTLTVVASALRKAGATAVHPFVLAQAVSS